MQVSALPGEIVLDFCAGSGGKSLVIAQSMEQTGKLYLHDVRDRLLTQARTRLRKAGITNYELITSESENLKKLVGKCNWVVVDVPSSGTGVFRNNPELKWKYNDDFVKNCVEKQREIFSQAVKYLRRKNGKIVYITGSVLPEENAEQVKYFCLTHKLLLSKEPVHSLPQSRGMNGFFCAVMERSL